MYTTEQSQLQLLQTVYGSVNHVIMVALWNRADHYIVILSFVLLLLSFFPRLISAVAEWMSALLAHMVWPWYEFKMQV